MQQHDSSNTTALTPEADKALTLLNVRGGLTVSELKALVPGLTDDDLRALKAAQRINIVGHMCHWRKPR